ncbi:uncharacterized protein KRP23_11066 [Phytophthora ramorum]|uniref:uncharacterized protein n=1 Tax=Phytophthora ramorum TaxID=164328 RepID=UPI00309E86B0|nr:hypothetical protein KRP23_11066 [Phytophthora ramorum]
MQLLAALSMLAAMCLQVVSGVEASATSYMMQTTTIYTDATCSGPAVNVLVLENDNCSANPCSLRGFGDNSDYYKAVTCYSADSYSYDPMGDLFQGKAFIEGQAYSNVNCTDDAYLYRQGLVVGGCEPFTTRHNHSVSVTLSSDGSAALIMFNNTDCTEPPITTYALGNETLTNHLCYEGISNTGLVQVIAKYFVYQDYDSSGSSNMVGTTESEGSSDTATLVGVVGAVGVVVLVVAVLIGRKLKANKRLERDDTLAMMEVRPGSSYLKSSKTEHSSNRTTMPVQTGDRAWDDDTIVAARIPRDKVVVETLSVNYFSDAYCASPVYSAATTLADCSSSACTSAITSSGTYYTSTTCPSDGLSGAAEVFGDTGYLLADVYIEADCETSYGQDAFLASGDCEMSGDGSSVIATLFTNGSAKLQYFVDSACSISIVETIYISEDLLTSHTCYTGTKYYSNSGGSATNGVGSSTVSAASTSSSGGGTTTTGGSTTTTSSTFLDSSGTTTTDGSGSSSSSSVSVGLIAGIAGGCIILLLIAIGCCCCWRRRRKNTQQQNVHVNIPSPMAYEQIVTPVTQFRDKPRSSAKRTTETETLSSNGGTIMSK